METGVSTVVVLTSVEAFVASTSVAMEIGGGDEDFVFCFLRGGFCGEGFDLGAIVGGFLVPLVVLRPAVVGFLGFVVVCFCGGEGGLGNMARGGLLCLCDFLLVEVLRFFVFIFHSLLSFRSFPKPIPLFHFDFV
ncbi:hypothetical protein Hanom_Chr15g01394171 [Helianthus anomalus]